MEPKEIRKIINNSPYSGVLNELEMTVDLSHIKESYRLKGLYNIFKFFYEQNLNWSKIISNKYEGCFSDSLNFFKNGLSNLESFINSYIVHNNIDANTIQYYFINGFLNRQSQYNSVFTYDAPSVEYLLGIYDFDTSLFKPAFDYLANNNLNTVSKNSLQGYFLAYEFENKENSFLFNKREVEKKSISKIRNQIASLANEYEIEITNRIKKLEEDYSATEKLLKEKNHNSRLNLAEWLNHQRDNYKSFLSTTNFDFKNLFENTKQEFINQLNQYSEQIKLQEPVKYWNTRAEQLNDKANKILKWTIGISLLIAFSVYVLLWFTPEGLLTSLFDGDKSKAIRWSIVFIIFISVYFVVIRALLKFMFSNFHLARDAEEREKLTYLYLSLLSRGDFSEEEKKIVFQALFSRSDTGLLKEDSSPTMPGVTSIFDRIR